MTKTFTALALSLAALVGTNGSVLAQTADRVTISVATADLDLASPADRARLETRLNSAIDRVCRSAGRDADALRAERLCRVQFRAEAQDRVDVAIAQANATRLAALPVNPGA